MANEITRLRDLKIGARDMFTVDPEVIVTEDKFNPRNYRLPENRAHLDELKESIKANGVLVPLLVRFDTGTKTAILVDGECRLRAVRELIKEGAEIKGVPVIQVPGNNEADRLLTAITANTGKPLSKWELGGAFRRFVSYGWPHEDIAAKTGYKVRFITEAIELDDAPDDVKYLLSEQAVTPSLALSEIRKSGAGASLILRQRAEAARSTGKKTAKRNVAPPKKTVNLLSLVRSLLKDVKDADLNNEEYVLIDVNRIKLLKVSQFADTLK
jgi:ParB/RepB/Spo0J family partition protein